MRSPREVLSGTDHNPNHKLSLKRSSASKLREKQVLSAFCAHNKGYIPRATSQPPRMLHNNTTRAWEMESHREWIFNGSAPWLGGRFAPEKKCWAPPPPPCDTFPAPVCTTPPPLLGNPVQIRVGLELTAKSAKTSEQVQKRSKTNEHGRNSAKTIGVLFAHSWPSSSGHIAVAIEGFP